jgi:hypothetical protein
MTDRNLTEEKEVVRGVRYCIGCVHLYLQPKFDGYMGTEWTGRYGEEDPALLCNQGHWREEMNKKKIAFGANMTRARTCEDYEERSDD